jgi:hypothetical protein
LNKVAIVLVWFILTSSLFFPVGAQNVEYIIMEKRRVTYYVHRLLVDHYGHQILSEFLDFVEVRFEKIMNITHWSSEKYYGDKLSLCVNPAIEGQVSPPFTFLCDSFIPSHYSIAALRLDLNITRENLNTPNSDPLNLMEPHVTVTLFLHELIHGIQPPPIIARRWLLEGYADFLSLEVQVMFGDVERQTVDELYNRAWEVYVKNGYLDQNNKPIQDDIGGYVTAWMFNNISKTYGWATHERFFECYDQFRDDFQSLLNSIVNRLSSASPYDIDSLIVGCYSLAAGKSLYGSFRSWGVTFLPNPIVTAISLSGILGQSDWYISEVKVSLSAIGENDIDKIEYSFDNKTWNTYTGPLSIAGDGIFHLYYRSSDKVGNTEIVRVRQIRIDKTPPAGFIFINGKVGQNQTVCVGKVVTFDARRFRDYPSGVAVYQWDFGDGAMEAGAVVTHNYLSLGTYIVKLIVGDRAGNNATMAFTVTVIQEPPSYWELYALISALFSSLCTFLLYAGVGIPKGDDYRKEINRLMREKDMTQAKAEEVLNRKIKRIKRTYIFLIFLGIMIVVINIFTRWC